MTGRSPVVSTVKPPHGQAGAQWQADEALPKQLLVWRSSQWTAAASILVQRSVQLGMWLFVHTSHLASCRQPHAWRLQDQPKSSFHAMLCRSQTSRWRITLQ